MRMRSSMRFALIIARMAPGLGEGERDEAPMMLTARR